MSLIDDVLIAIDEEPRSKDSLEVIFNEINPAFIFSAVGRLLSRNHIMQIGIGKNIYYKVTPTGDLEIKYNLLGAKKVLSNLPIDIYLISVANTEKNKPEREKIRTFLKNNGFALINNGLLINGLVDYKFFSNKLSHISRNSQILYFKINEVPRDIINILKMPNLNNKYQAWLKLANKFITDIPKDVNIKRLFSKILIYNLSLIINSDCKVNNKNLYLKKSKKIYKKIRDYCYI